MMTKNLLCYAEWSSDCDSVPVLRDIVNPLYTSDYNVKEDSPYAAQFMADK